MAITKTDSGLTPANVSSEKKKIFGTSNSVVVDYFLQEGNTTIPKAAWQIRKVDLLLNNFVFIANADSHNLTTIRF